MQASVEVCSWTSCFFSFASTCEGTISQTELLPYGFQVPLQVLVCVMLCKLVWVSAWVHKYWAPNFQWD